MALYGFVIINRVNVMAKVNRINTEDYGVCWCAVVVVCLKVLLCACVCSITCTSTVMWCHKQYETKSTSTSTARISRWTSSCHTSPVNHRSKYTVPHLLVIFPLCKLSCFLLAFIYPDFSYDPSALSWVARSLPGVLHFAGLMPFLMPS